MLAWRGGRRRLIREQKARRKLEAVFNAAAKISKPASKPRARSRALATVEALGAQFSALRTRPTPPEEEPISAEDESPPASAAAAAQPPPEKFRVLPAFPNLNSLPASRAGISLDILAIQGSSRHLKTSFKSPDVLAEQEKSNENNLALETDNHPARAAAVAAAASAPFSRSQLVSDKSTSLHKKRQAGKQSHFSKYIYNGHTSAENQNSDADPMSLEL